MNKLVGVRGTRDIFDEEMNLFNIVVDNAKIFSKQCGFKEIATPILEPTELFIKLGESSDVVSKEIYSFLDKGEKHLSLRPEFTAGIVRAFIANGLHQKLPLKLFSAGPLFRRERPQKGRYRQFHQINFESIGQNNPQSDAELIIIANDLLKEKYKLRKNITLEINSIGDLESRSNYRQKLIEYLSKYKSDLSQDSIARLEKNPLRILDSKDEKDQQIIKNAPVILESLTKDSRKHYDQILQYLSDNDIPYKQNHCLVRGLDYYTDTVFEFTTDSLGSQGTLLAGGRYNGLIKSMGGKETPALGFAAGVERLADMIKEQSLESFNSLEDEEIKIALLPISEEARKKSFSILRFLRNNDMSVELISEGKLSKGLKKANAISATHCIIVGEEEIKLKKYRLKNLETGEEGLLSESEILMMK